jgi:nitrate reductase NapD
MTICSLVVQTRPENVSEVSATLKKIDGVEIHVEDERGKLVICIDHPSREHCSKVMTDITGFKGVMSTSLIYEVQDDLLDDT